MPEQSLARVFLKYPVLFGQLQLGTQLAHLQTTDYLHAAHLSHELNLLSAAE